MTNKKIASDTSSHQHKLSIPRTFWIGLYGYLTLIILLGAFSLLGWYSLTPVSTLGLGSCILLFNVAVITLLYFRIDTRLRDRELAFTQCLLAIAVTGIALFHTAPALRFAVAVLPLLWLVSQQSNLTSRRLGILMTAAVAVYLISSAELLMNAQAGVQRLRPLIMACVLLLVYSSFFFPLRFIKRLRRLGIKQQNELKKLRRQLSDLALQDSLTNAYKRSFIMRLLEQEKARVDRHGATFSVCLFKINGMEAVNKQAGYMAGDQVIRYVADSLLTAIRKSDNVGRIHGSYFLALLPATPEEGAREFAERIQTRIAAQTAHTVAGEQAVTVSISVTEYEKGETGDALLLRLEQAVESK